MLGAGLRADRAVRSCHVIAAARADAEAELLITSMPMMLLSAVVAEWTGIDWALAAVMPGGSRPRRTNRRCWPCRLCAAKFATGLGRPWSARSTTGGATGCDTPTLTR